MRRRASEDGGVMKVGRRNKTSRQKGLLGSRDHGPMDVNKVDVHLAPPPPNTENKGRTSCQSMSEDPASLARQVQEFTQKLKFQFFPVDDVTRKVLQEDGHNPHLELILGGKKKISSVVKRLVSKWGSSRVAVGELMLFPYDSLSKNALKREYWGLNDAEISASDIHRAMGCPAILRLRYGWLPDAPLNGNSPDKLSNTMAIDDKVGLCLKANREFASNVGEAQPSTDKKALAACRNVDGKEKVKADAAWIDGLTNMSFQELFTRANVASSEATQACQLPLETNSRSQQIPFICDSFDAAIAAQLHQIHATTQPANFPASSILDAEETCHGFPVQRNLPKDDFLHSSGNPVLPLEHDVLQPKPTDTEGEQFLGMQSNVLEESLPKSHSQEVGDGCCETTTGISSQSLSHNCNGNSIGLANISWDSGTQGFCPPSKTSLGGSESIDFGSLLARSRDGHRNCSSNSDKTTLPL